MRFICWYPYVKTEKMEKDCIQLDMSFYIHKKIILSVKFNTEIAQFRLQLTVERLTLCMNVNYIVLQERAHSILF
jgi:hypothetical protein